MFLYVACTSTFILLIGTDNGGLLAYYIYTIGALSVALTGYYQVRAIPMRHSKSSMAVKVNQMSK